MLPNTIEAYRERFKDAPVGCWSSWWEFLAPYETLEVRPDQTGMYYFEPCAGLWGYLEQPFEWKESKDYAILLRWIGWEKQGWEEFRYDFTLEEFYTKPAVCLCRIRRPSDWVVSTLQLTAEYDHESSGPGSPVYAY